MYCGIWGLISFPSSSSSAGASPALRASSNSNCFLWSSLDLNAAANQIWPSSQDHLTHKNSHTSKFGCKAECQTQRTNKFHNYLGKETSTHEEREREREREQIRVKTRTPQKPQTSCAWKSDFKNFGQRNEKKKRRPKHSERDGDKDDHTHTQSGKKREKGMKTTYMMRLPWFLVLANCRILKTEYLPNEFLAQILVMQHAWKQTKENKKRGNAPPYKNTKAPNPNSRSLIPRTPGPAYSKVTKHKMKKVAFLIYVLLLLLLFC
jgi:hypothetical protein